MDTSTKTMVKVENLSTGYTHGRRKVFISQNISVKLSEGEFACLLGPNGAGKSTLFRTLIGFLPPLSGNILIDSKPLTSIDEKDLSKKLSVVLTERPDVSSMTVYQLVALGRAPYTGFWGKISETDDNVIKKSLTLTNSYELKERMVTSLSDGERQRVMIAKAIAQETPLIILDEPTAFLDFGSKVEMMQLLREIAHKQNKTILLSSHDVNMALKTADTLWLLDKKLGFVSGSPARLAADNILQPYFIREGISFNSSEMCFSID